MEPARLSTAVVLGFITVQATTQAFFMGLLFLVAGYFAPGSLERKGPRRFLLDRAVRLGIPSLLYVFAIHPLNVYVLLAPLRGESPADFPRAYLSYYLTRLELLSGTGPLWFAVALLVFSAVYTLGRSLWPKARAGVTAGLPGHNEVALLVLAMAACTFLVRTVQPIGTSLYNMQLCFFSQYVLLFAVGVRAYRGDWLRRIPYGFGIGWFKGGLLTGAALWVLLLAFGGALSGDTRAYESCLRWQSAGLSLWESIVCAAMCLGLIVVYREKLNHQGRLAKLLSDNAFAVYVFHAPLVIGIALLMRGLAAHPVTKFLLLSALSVCLSFLACHPVLRRVPGLRRVL